jgi:hypothetical protein
VNISPECTDHFIFRILVEPCDEECSLVGPFFIDLVVYIAFIEDINAAFWWLELSEEIFIIGAGSGQPDQFGHHVVKGKNCMSLQSAFLFS